MKKGMIIDQVKQLGGWFHQIDLGEGLFTRSISPSEGPQPLNHPINRWKVIEKHLPEDLNGCRILDIGCAEGFFSIELARRGADVLAVDAAPKMIKRMDWVVKHLKLSSKIKTKVANLESFHKCKENFDYVFMIALLYHLQHPLLGLQIVSTLANKLYLESTLHTSNDDAYLYLKPPQIGVHSIPKWYPTEKCIYSMLDYVGFNGVQTLEQAAENRGIYYATRT